MTQEKTIHALSGWLILPCVLVGYICGLYHIAAYICKHTNEFGSLVLPCLLDPADISTVFISILLILLAFTLQCGCLLYTSPSPRDRTRSRMPSSA